VFSYNIRLLQWINPFRKHKTPCLIGASILKSNRAKEVVSDFESISKERYSYQEIESRTSFVVNLSSKEEYREIFRNMLKDCYKYAATAINAKGQGSIIRLVHFSFLLLYS
jgi:hypothetical protein